MALMITDDCINCDVCEPECPNGAIFLGLTFWARKKLPKDAVRLLTVTSVCTMVWGLITGTIFGINPEILARAGLVH